MTIPLKRFEEFLIAGTIRKRSPDQLRANSLFSEAHKRKKFVEELLQKIVVSDQNANYFIENCYDTLIGLIRAKMVQEGYQAGGEGAHEAEVSFMRKLQFEEVNVRFMNDLRYFRNGILYYGKACNAEYAKRVIEFMKVLYPQLGGTQS